MVNHPPYTLAAPDQFLLFGDSITQQCFSPNTTFSLGAALTDAYVRRLDIVNRGLSGYNSTQALRALPLCIPEPEHTNVRFLTICFGANDARLAGSPGGPSQTVPLDEFRRNVKAMVQHPCVIAHKDIRIILVTTPPIDERTLSQHDHETYGNLPKGTLRRTAANTAAYAEAVRTLGEELNIPVCDIHTAMIARAGHSRSHASSSEEPSSTTTTTTTQPGSSASTIPTEQSETSTTTRRTTTSQTSPNTNPPGSLTSPGNKTLQSFFTDGLHFSGDGYRVLFGELMSLIEKTWPDQMPARLPMRLPPWDFRPAWQTGDEGGGVDRGGGGGVEGLRVRGTFEAVIQAGEREG